MSYIDQEKLLEATNGGLDIILHYYPEAEKSAQAPSRKFKLRANEKTASASLKKLGDGNWVVTDFGGDGVPRNGVQVCMVEENMEFRDAIQFLAAHFNVAGEDGRENFFQCEYEKAPAGEDQEEGGYYYVTKEFTEKELELLGGKYFTATMAQKQKLHSLECYMYVKKDKDTRELVQHIFKSTENYPVFQFIFEDKELGTWGKRLEPRAKDKAQRFRYFGKRPKNYIMGLHLVKKAHLDLNTADDEGYESMDEMEQKESRKSKKLQEVILCSGDRDAFSVMSLGYQVVWLNSETAKLSRKQFADLQSLAWKVISIPDIDTTGVREGHKLAMEHLDLHVLRLPAELKQKRDHRGNPCKDVRDYLQHYKSFDFKQLVKLAIPYRMWDETWQYNKTQDKYYRTYTVNLLQTYNFLAANGFYRFRLPNTKSGYIYIRVQDSVVEEIDHVEIKAFVNKFLEDRQMEPDIRNTFFRSRNHLGEQSLSNLPLVEIDFTDYTRTSQFLFFQNKTWEVSKEGIREFKPGEVEKMVWKDEVIQHRVRAWEKPPFEVTYNEATDEYDIKIHRKDCLFLRYLINTSRIYWREEEELASLGQKLPDEKRHEQRLHLINKLYSLGYLLHRYKDPDRPWAVYAMDNKLSEDGESHGGSGKSIAFKAVRYFMKYVTLEGRNPRLTDNPHIWENVTNHTDYILVDDANQYLKFDFFYSILTGEMIVNPKHGKQYEIPYEEVPKMAITSNFGLRNTDPSTERRLLYTVFSDYYHFKNNEDEYERSWSPAEEFGKNLFQDFTEDEWNAFFNTMAAALQVYLHFGKINPPMENVTKRNLIVKMTDEFKEWADVYFSGESGNLNASICKKSAYDDFLDQNAGAKRKFGKINRFTKSLKAWCQYYGYTLNPGDLVNDQAGRIIRKVDGNTIEYFHIRTHQQALEGEENLKPF